jgi:hypothetical protein
MRWRWIKPGGQTFTVLTNRAKEEDFWSCEDAGSGNSSRQVIWYKKANTDGCTKVAIFLGETSYRYPIWPYIRTINSERHLSTLPWPLGDAPRQSILTANRSRHIGSIFWQLYSFPRMLISFKRFSIYTTFGTEKLTNTQRWILALLQLYLWQAQTRRW